MATSPADFLMDGVLSAETDGEAETEGGHREGAAVHSVSVCWGRGGAQWGGVGGTGSQEGMRHSTPGTCGEGT